MSSDAGANVSPIVIEVFPLPAPEAVVGLAAPVVVAPPAVVDDAAVVVGPLGLVVATEPLLSPEQAAATRPSARAATATDCFHFMGFLRKRRWTGTGHGRRATSPRSSLPAPRARWPGRRPRPRRRR